MNHQLQTNYKIASPLLPTAAVQRVFATISQHVEFPIGFSVSLVTVGAAEMQRLNKQYRQVDAVTDVLSFPYNEQEGEVVICYPQAVQQAKRKQVAVRRELQWLLIHGILHLLGYDHETAADAKVMRPLERTILQQLV